MEVTRSLWVVVLMTLSFAELASQGAAPVRTRAETRLAETRPSAEEGDASAQYIMGVIYDIGQGVPPDFTLAVAWYREAADQGHADAQYNLAAMYSTGRGVPQDYVEAYKWRSLAASRATGETQQRYEEARDALAKLMTPAQLAEAERLAREWQAAFEERPE